MSLTPCPRTGLPPFGIPIIVTHTMLGCPLPSGLGMHVIITYPALGGSLPPGSPSLILGPGFGSSSLLDVGHSHPAPLGRALRDYGHYYPVHGEDVLDPTPFAAHSHSGLGPTPTLLIRHPCARNKIVRYFEFLSNQRSARILRA